ncbi:hypothetical protein E5288_WYG012162 [Bos mutus]|uniref:Uncharacterized protein n=1 Tax=Bos mutus TaxID=72004 RepID=A0A6B0SJ08_9CETA|nr:hypothetical protein [Bos mutus]
MRPGSGPLTHVYYFAGRGSHACSVPAGPLAPLVGACAGPNGCPDAEDLALLRFPLRQRGRSERLQVVDIGLGPEGFPRAIRTQERKNRHSGGGWPNPRPVFQAGRGWRGGGAARIAGLRSVRNRGTDHEGLDRLPKHGELEPPRPPGRALPDCQLLGASAARAARVSVARPRLRSLAERAA